MCPGPDRGANLLFCVTQCFLAAPGSGTPKFFKLGRADDSLPEWRSAEPSLNSISEFRLNLYVIGRRRRRLLKNEPEGRIENLSGPEKFQLRGPFFPIIAASSHF